MPGIDATGPPANDAAAPWTYPSACSLRYVRWWDAIARAATSLGPASPLRSIATAVIAAQVVVTPLTPWPPLPFLLKRGKRPRRELQANAKARNLRRLRRTVARDEHRPHSDELSRLAAHAASVSGWQLARRVALRRLLAGTQGSGQIQRRHHPRARYVDDPRGRARGGSADDQPRALGERRRIARPEDDARHRPTSTNAPFVGGAQSPARPSLSLTSRGSRARPPTLRGPRLKGGAGRSHSRATYRAPPRTARAPPERVRRVPRRRRSLRRTASSRDRRALVL